MINKWTEGMDIKLNGKFPWFRYKFKWTELVYDILWQYSNQYTYNHIDYNLVAPIHWKDWQLFFDNKVPISDIITEHTISVMMFNKYMFARLERMSEDEILQSDMLVRKIFRYALNYEKP